VSVVRTPRRAAVVLSALALTGALAACGDGTGTDADPAVPPGGGIEDPGPPGGGIEDPGLGDDLNDGTEPTG
jgi:hypothetical protein